MGFSVSFTGCVKRSRECWNETHIINASARSKDQKETRRREPRVSASHLLPSEPDKADT
jgi:hypothetical protein